MSQTPPPSDTRDDPPLDLAAEYVLGVLAPEDWDAAQARLAVDPVFAAEVAVWEARLTPLVLAAEAISPTRDLWPQIRKALPANDITGTRDGLTFWRGLTAASAFIAVVCLTIRRTACRVGYSPNSNASLSRARLGSRRACRLGR